MDFADVYASIFSITPKGINAFSYTFENNSSFNSPNVFTQPSCSENFHSNFVSPIAFAPFFIRNTNFTLESVLLEESVFITPSSINSLICRLSNKSCFISMQQFLFAPRYPFVLKNEITPPA